MFYPFLLLILLVPAGGATETGRVRLEAIGRDIVDVIHLIAEAAGEEVFIYPEVEGRVNVRIEDLPFEEALSLVLAAKGEGYTWRQMDRVYHIGRWEESPAPATAVITETFPLRHREARRLARLFGYVDMEALDQVGEASLFPLLPAGLTFSPQPVPMENALLLRGSPSAIKQMVALLRRIDRKMPQVEVRFQTFATTPEVIDGIKLHWGQHPGLRLQGSPEPVWYATRDFGKLLEKLSQDPFTRLWAAPVVVTNHLAPAHLVRSEGPSPSLENPADNPPAEDGPEFLLETLSEGALTEEKRDPPRETLLGEAETAEEPARPAETLPEDPLAEDGNPMLKLPPGFRMVPAGSLLLSLIPRIEPGHLVRLWFRAGWSVKASEEEPPRFQVTLLGDGLSVPPGESLALYLPSLGSSSERGYRPPLLVFATPRVLEDEEALGVPIPLRD